MQLLAWERRWIKKKIYSKGCVRVGRAARHLADLETAIVEVGRCRQLVAEGKASADLRVEPLLSTLIAEDHLTGRHEPRANSSF